MKHFRVAEAEGRLAQLLDLVEAGEEVVITRDGRPVARMVQAAAHAEKGSSHAAAQRIRTMRKGVTLRGIAIRDLIAEGRQ